jgi:hypothetical protein
MSSSITSSLHEHPCLRPKQSLANLTSPIKVQTTCQNRHLTDTPDSHSQAPVNTNLTPPLPEYTIFTADIAGSRAENVDILQRKCENPADGHRCRDSCCILVICIENLSKAATGAYRKLDIPHLNLSYPKVVLFFFNILLDFSPGLWLNLCIDVTINASAAGK